MSVTIRPATVDDRESIRRILVSTAIFRDDEISAALELLDRGLNVPRTDDFSVIVAAGTGKDSSTVHGYVLYGPMPKAEGVFDLYWIAVDPARQGQGIGGLLLRFTEQEVRRQNGRLLLIETSSRESYAPTMRFYTHSGYEEVSRVKDFHRIEDDKVILGKHL